MSVIEEVDPDWRSDLTAEYDAVAPEPQMY